MAINFRRPAHLPGAILSELDAYLEDDEEIVDALMETLVLAIDFRWLILTNMRVILAIQRMLSTEFRDVRFDGLDMQLKKSFFFDDLHIKSMTDDYHASFYSMARPRTEEFLQELEDERDRFQKEKKKYEKLIEQEAMEELGAKGPLDEPRIRKDVLADIDHDQNVLDKRIAEQRKSQEEEAAQVMEQVEDGPSDNLELGHAKVSTALKILEDLMILRNEGAITQEEFDLKKRDILNNI